ncbi:hypothetical protein G6L05_32875 [Agrobacterium rhizogenes]|nr:hypothetical protein [Rhizobium rhizogenes]
MKFIDMTSLGLPPGRLTVWRTSAPHISDTAWTDDLRRASYVQEAHITYALEAAGEGPLPPSWLGCSFDLPAELDVDAFAEALRCWTDRHEILRSQLTLSTPDGRLRRMTLPAGAVSIGSSAEGDFTDGRALERYLEELFHREAGPLGWPGYICATISHPEATTVCLAADHTLTDGYSIFLTPYEIQTLYAVALTAQDGAAPPPPLPPTASYLDFAEAERTAADVLTPDHETIVRWRQFLTEAGGHLPEFPVPVGDVSGRPAAQPGGYAQLLDAPAAHAFDRACRAAGGDTFSGLLACLAKIGHEITGSGEFRTMVAFHTRTPPWRSSIGWYVGMAPLAFPLSATDSLAEAVRSAASGLDGIKDLARIPIPRVEEVLGQPLHDPFMVSYMDLRRTPGARDWNTWRVITLRGRNINRDDVYFWIMRTHDGLFVNYRHPATGPASIAVPHYVAHVKHLLASIVSTACWPAVAHPTGGYCP